MPSHQGGILELGITTILVALTGVFFIAFMRGAFGGGFAIIGIPFLSMVVDPLTAGALLAPLFIAMDIFALRYWGASTWSRPDLTVLLPSLVVGIGLGYVALSALDRRVVTIVIAAVTLAFTALWFWGGGQVLVRPRSIPKAIAAGVESGVATMMAHSGGPPLAMYLLPLGLAKEVYAGTTSLFFTVGNATKAVPWLLLVKPSANVWTLMSVWLMAVPLGIWTGWKLHQRLDRRRLYLACYGLLTVAALKLLSDGVSGYLG
jgi:uncharacterized protein